MVEFSFEALNNLRRSVCLQCSASDLDYYIRECGEIVGVTAEIDEDSLASTGPMAILDHVFKRLIRFKMLNQVSYHQFRIAPVMGLHGDTCLKVDWNGRVMTEGNSCYSPSELLLRVEEWIC